MTVSSPKVSIGLPVYNGENFIAQAIESVLAQTFPDFELIISDNASADRTGEICRTYAKQDGRIRYICHETNRGATWNFNYAFTQSAGTYFAWLAHDDQWMPDFLQEAVDVLDASPDAAVCFSKIQIIDENNRPIAPFDVEMRTGSQKTHERFYDLLMVWHDCLPIFGLIRAGVLEQTNLIGAYGLGDAVLLAHLGLLGRFEKLPEPLFLSRRHALQSNKRFNIWIDHHAYDRWFRPVGANKVIFPQWEVFIDLIRMVARVQLHPRERLLCYRAIARWVVRYRRLLWKDCTIGLKQLVKPSRPSLEAPVEPVESSSRKKQSAV